MFRVGLTRDFLKPDGTNGFGDIGLERFEQAGIAWEYLPTVTPELDPSVADTYDGLLVLAPRVSQRTVAEASRLKIVARFGVGYDNVDVPACTAAGIVLTITPEGVRRPVAAASLALLLALTHKMLIKDRLIRAGRWADRLDFNGQGTTGRTMGIVGFGNIGQELARLARPFEMRMIAADPFAPDSVYASSGVERVTIDELMAQSDYVCICCALTPETRGLIDARRIGLMKRNAYLINMARGPIVQQAALYDALVAGTIQGAGLDVFEQEPIAPDDPLLKLENVILAPHSLCWTDECFRLMAKSAVDSLIDVAQGRTPTYPVNRDALNHPRYQKGA